MGVKKRSPQQTAFIEEHVASYNEHQDKKAFWPGFFDEWFKQWPAAEADRKTIIAVSVVSLSTLTTLTHILPQQVKRVVKTTAENNAAGGRRNLHLESGPKRRGSEVQIYMRLYYDARIRETVLKQWKEADLKYMEANVRLPPIPEDSIDPEDSYLFKDERIPVNFKNHVAQKLYEKEEEAIVASVQAQRKQELNKLTVYTAKSEEDRLDLVRELHK